MKVLVTGGAGFIGSNLCRRLAQSDRVSEVRVIDDLATGHRANLDGVAVKFIEASILDPDALTDAARGVDSIVHLAALGSVPRSINNPTRTHEVNATGTLRVLEAARAEAAHFVMSSSSSVYGSNRTLPKTEDIACMPMSPYAVSKLAAEQYANVYREVYGLSVLPFRFFNVFGPAQRAGHVYAAVIPVFLDAALRGSPLPVNGDGLQSRDFTYVGTVVDAIEATVAGRLSGPPTNLAFGTQMSLRELVTRIETVLGHAVTIEPRPPRDGDVAHTRADASRLRHLLPDLRPVEFDDGLRETVQWMRSVVGGT